MIYDKLENFKQYINVNPNFKAVYDFICKNDLLNLPLGKQVISDNVYFNRQQYVGKELVDNKFESHIKYIDVQIILGGVEKSFYSTDKPNLPDEENEKDCYFTYTDNKIEYTQEANVFAIYFPNELHKPALNVDGKNIEKLLFKVKAE